MINFDQLVAAPCIAQFGQPALYRPGAGVPVRLSGIFNRFATDEKMQDTGEARQIVVPTIGVRIADLRAGAPLPCRGEVVEVDGSIWRITEVTPDGFGMLTLRLTQL